MKSWRRDEVELGMLFTKDDIGLLDEPVAVLVPVDGRDGEEREHHVISSLNFTEFRRVELVDADGARQFAPSTTSG